VILHPHVEVRRSSIHGLGIFATKPIGKGEPVTGWRAEKDFVLTEAEWAALPENLRKYLHTFCWRSHDGRQYGSHDDSRFTNHSTVPTLIYVEADCTSYAARDIVADEELTEDYEAFDAAFDEYDKELE
jgi:SET domain-containing protein